MREVPLFTRGNKLICSQEEIIRWIELTMMWWYPQSNQLCTWRVDRSIVNCINWCATASVSIVGIIQYLCCIYPVFTYMYLWRFGISYVASGAWECVSANRMRHVRCNIFVAKIAACELNLGCRDFSLDWDNPRNYNTFYSNCASLSCADLRS